MAFSAYITPEGTAQIQQGFVANKKFVYDVLFDDDHQIIAVGFRYNKEIFPSLPENTHVIFKFFENAKLGNNEHVEILSHGTRKTTVPEMNDAFQGELEIAFQLKEECEKIREKNSKRYPYKRIQP